MEEEERDDSAKVSKRDRFKGALARTKTKLTKRDKSDGRQQDEVEDFLAAGRNSTSTGRPSVSDSLAFADDPFHPPTSDSTFDHPSPETISRDPAAHPQPSPRRVVVPKLDVSHSQRWPNAQPVGSQSSDFLRPEYQSRSQSVSSFAKGRGRARGLSVQFTEKPPDVIGEGGDEAQMPPIEVSKAKSRARSLSPAPTPKESAPGFWGRSPKRKPAPDQTPTPLQTNIDFVSPGVKRVQTGLVSAVSESKSAFEKEFEMSLGLSSASTNSNSGSAVSQKLPMHAPKPVHPPIAYPAADDFKIPSTPHHLKAEAARSDLRSEFREDAAPTLPELRSAFRDDAAPTLPDIQPISPQHYQSKTYSPEQGRFYATHSPQREQPGRPRASSVKKSSGPNPQQKPGENWI